RLHVGTPRLENALRIPLPKAATLIAASSLGHGETKASNGPIDDSLWTIQIPPGYRLAASQAGLMLANATEQELGRAAAMLEISRELSAAAATRTIPSADLVAAQERFYRFCRYAQERLTL